MKKRAQLPDARTFTILFRGLAMHPDQHRTLGQALSIYHSMYAENCPVKPSIIHTNAVLNVCARVKDIDALYGVAAKLPTHGAGAANNFTFTTIMNAIRAAAWGDKDGSSREEKIVERRQAVLQGRRMWGDIIERWKKGDISIDEQIVCSMGRLLLLGDLTRDHDAIFSLVEQTMGIPRQMPRSSHPDRPVGIARAHVWKQEENTEPPGLTVRELGSAADSSSGIQLPENEIPEDEPGSEFNPVGAHKMSLARPGCNTLSMVVDTCVRLHAIRPAQDYWGLLTDPSGPYQIVPDAENYHMYLRLLRAQRASRLSVDLIQEMRHISQNGKSILQPKTFRIALSTCVRDSNNPNVLNNAGKLVRMMLDTLETPDVASLIMYLEVAKHPQHRDWRVLMGVLRGSVLGFRSLKSFLSYGDHGRPTRGAQRQPEAMRKVQERIENEVVDLACKLVSAHDVTLSLGKEEMSTRDRIELSGQKVLLVSWVTRRRGSGRSLEDKQKEWAPDRPVVRRFRRPKQVKGSAAVAVTMGFGDLEMAEGEPVSRTPDLSSARATETGPAPPPGPGGAASDGDGDLSGQDGGGGGWKRYLGDSYRPSIFHAMRNREDRGEGKGSDAATAADAATDGDR